MESHADQEVPAELESLADMRSPADLESAVDLEGPPTSKNDIEGKRTDLVVPPV